tara:strand:- start:234 stop:458 length:225 start_codon:yes stop_codon:yes gene_type:complete
LNQIPTPLRLQKHRGLPTKIASEDFIVERARTPIDGSKLSTLIDAINKNDTVKDNKQDTEASTLSNNLFSPLAA